MLPKDSYFVLAWYDKESEWQLGTLPLDYLTEDDVKALFGLKEYEGECLAVEPKQAIQLDIPLRYNDYEFFIECEQKVLCGAKEEIEAKAEKDKNEVIIGTLTIYFVGLWLASGLLYQTYYQADHRLGVSLMSVGMLLGLLSFILNSFSWMIDKLSPTFNDKGKRDSKIIKVIAFTADCVWLLLIASAIITG